MPDDHIHLYRENVASGPLTPLVPILNMNCNNYLYDIII